MDGLKEKPEDVTRGLQEFLDLLLDHTGLELDSRIEACDPANPVDIEAPDIVVDLSGPDADLLLEERSDLLRAIEYLAHRWIDLDPAQAARIRFDSQGYRAGRVAELGLAARTAAEQVRTSGRPFHFQPMNARERRIVHLALRDAEDLRTSSEGEGFDRAVTIHPA